MAVYCCVKPLAIDMLTGLTAIETSSSTVTVIFVVSEITPLVAVMVVAPTETAVVNPLAFTLAMPVFAEDHVTVPVISAVDESVYVPVAVYGKVLPFATDPFIGVTAIETSSFAVTVILVVSEIAPLVAVILDAPLETALANPLAFILATPELVEDHVTAAVISSVEKSV